MAASYIEPSMAFGDFERMCRLMEELTSVMSCEQLARLARTFADAAAARTPVVGEPRSFSLGQHEPGRP